MYQLQEKLSDCVKLLWYDASPRYVTTWAHACVSTALSMQCVTDRGRHQANGAQASKCALRRGSTSAQVELSLLIHHSPTKYVLAHVMKRVEAGKRKITAERATSGKLV